MLLRTAFAILTILCFGVGLSALRFLAIPAEYSMAHMLHYLTAVPVFAYGHMIGGPLALMLVPLQFSSRLRQRRPRLHRLSGFLYVASVLVSGLSALLMLPHFAGTRWALAGFVVLAVLWMLSTLVAFWHARARRFERHRRWMMRS